jgi:signal transduction histidine kinase
MDIELVDPEQILTEVEALMEPLALKKGIAFRCQRPATPLRLESDARKIRQILLNLVTNAIKFTDHGDVELRLLKQGDDVIYEVSDTGIGIAPEHQEKVFEAFWRVENTATRATGGTGLGLSVSRRLARFLGGDLTVRSRLHHGSTFSLCLPAVPLPVAERAKSSAPRAMAGDAT